MKINKNNNRKPLIIALVSILVVAALTTGVSALYLGFKNNDENKTDQTNTAAPERSESDKQQAEELKKSPENKAETPNTDTPPAIIENESSDKGSVDMIASADISRGSVFIRGGINNQIIGDGTCYASLVGPNGETIRKDTSLLHNSTSTDCKTISIPLSSLSFGVWKFTLNYESEKLKGVTSEESFEVK